MDIYQKIMDVKKHRLSAALCTVVAISGSTPRKPSAKMIVIDNGHSHGHIFGTVGGGAIEHAVRSEAVGAIKDRAARLVKKSLRNELGMCCGGEMTVFIEPIFLPPKLYCFGAGHINQALGTMALNLGFDLSLFDERLDLLTHDHPLRFMLNTTPLSKFMVDDLVFGPDTYVVIATHDHALDQMIVEWLIKKPCAYLSLVGSKRKASMTIKRLRAKDFNEHVIEKLICPAGLDIAAQTPEEIALAIASQMIAIKNQHNFAHKKPQPEVNHGSPKKISFENQMRQ